jgi:hypothetical protein
VDGDTDKEYKIVCMNMNASYSVQVQLNNAATSYGYHNLFNSAGSISSGRNSTGVLTSFYYGVTEFTLLTASGIVKMGYTANPFYGTGTTVDSLFLWGNNYVTTGNITLMNFFSNTGNFTSGTRITVYARRSNV